MVDKIIYYDLLSFEFVHNSINDNVSFSTYTKYNSQKSPNQLYTFVIDAQESPSI